MRTISILLALAVASTVGLSTGCKTGSDQTITQADGFAIGLLTASITSAALREDLEEVKIRVGTAKQWAINRYGKDDPAAVAIIEAADATISELVDAQSQGREIDWVLAVDRVIAVLTEQLTAMPVGPAPAPVAPAGETP